MKVGEKIGYLRPISGLEATAAPRSYPATVTYIHPTRMWITVEFALPGGRCRESFFVGARRGEGGNG